MVGDVLVEVLTSVEVTVIDRAAGLGGLEEEAGASCEPLRIGRLADLFEVGVQRLAHAIVTRAVRQVSWVAGIGCAATGVDQGRRAGRRLSQGQSVDDVLVVGDDDFRHRGGHGLDGRLEEVLALRAAHEAVRDGLGDPVERAALALHGVDDLLEGQEAGDREEVEHVVDGGAGEGALQLQPLPGLAHGDDGVGHGGADVRAHDDGDAGLDGDLVRAHEPHHDGRARGGGLHHDRGQDARHEARDGVLDGREHAAGAPAA
mmetsp:Transcript_58905/g.189435  ORF Transcript_58905/g.189435 Transcript_58905/m.189435 type:complete len:260 (-) Transcript_58905:206-985(-)